MGNLFTWPRAVVGQNWAAQLSLELKSSSQRLTEVSVGDPKEITHVLRTMAPKPNSLSRSLALSLSRSVLVSQRNVKRKFYYISLKVMQMFVELWFHLQ